MVRKRNNFLSLPLELLSEIAKNLDWLDLISLRMVRAISDQLTTHLTTSLQTCKLLNDVSKLRSVRIGLVERAIQSNPRATPLERPIQCYSAAELEEWAMRRLSVDKQWRSDSCEPVRTRQLKFSPSGIRVTCLVEGGRWLMAVFEDGTVRAADLDHSDMPEQLVISPRDELDTWPINGLLSDNVQVAGNLTFNLAVLHSGVGE